MIIVNIMKYEIVIGLLFWIQIQNSETLATLSMEVLKKNLPYLGFYINFVQ